MEEKQNVNGTKPKKKGKKKLIIILSIVAVLMLAVIIAGVKAMKAMNAVVQEQMTSMMAGGEGGGLFEVKKDGVKQEIMTTGVTTGLEKEAYISPVTAQVQQVCVEVGQIVEKGDVLLTFDPTKLGDDLEKVKIQARSQRASGNASFEEANKAANRASKANSKIDDLEDDIKDLKKDISKLQKVVDKYDEKIKADSKIPTTEAPTTEASKDESAGVEESQQVVQTTEEVKAPVSTDVLTASEKKEYKKASSDLAKKMESLTSKQQELAKQQSIAEANEDVTVSESVREQVSAQNELTDMELNQAQESYDAASAGIVANKKSIVESVDTIKGAVAGEGQTLVTLIDTEKIGVEFTISKSDLTSVREGQKARVVIGGKEYQGTVEFISRVAVADMSGKSSSGQIQGRILIDNPDDDIFIGVSTKTYIFVGEAKDALIIPYEALCSDIDGDFVYVVNDENLIERKDVKIGLCSDEYYEILEGVSEGDKVITNVTSNMKPGDQYAPEAAAEPGMVLGM